MMQQAVAEKFMSDDLGDLYQIVQTPEEVLPAIEKTQTWTKSIHDAGKLR
jgi:predicted Rossmann-fold nucleotide-binding protein